MGKISIAVLMGGKSSEHEISLISGREVVANLDKKKYEVFPVIIAKNGKLWRLVAVNELLSFRKDILKLKNTSGDLILKNTRKLNSVNEANKSGIDVVFVAMHGPFGEDGTIQGVLEMAGLKHTGSSVAASSIGMDKILFRKVMTGCLIPQPKYIVVEDTKSISLISKTLGAPPYFVKPHNQGSSVGASVVSSKKDLRKALVLAFKYSGKVLVDEYVQGKEFSCAVLGNNNPYALPVIEIKPLKGNFFDYDSKYSESGALETCPANIPTSLAKKIQKMAVEVHNCLGCRGFSRVDFLLKGSSHPVVLEINTIPGLTPTSLLPKAALAAGISYPQLLDLMIRFAKE